MDETLSQVDLVAKRASLGSLLIYFLCIAFAVLKIATHQLTLLHFGFLMGVFVAYLVHPLTRKIIIVALPLIIFGILYDSFRYIPFEALLPIHIEDLYNFDVKLFGVWQQGVLVPFHQFMHAALQNPILNLLTAICYFLHIPSIIFFFLLFYFKQNPQTSFRFALAMMVMNLSAFVVFFFFPTAAPWYVAKYGFVQPMMRMTGDMAGLQHAENMLGVAMFSAEYRLSPIVFGALPSMHVGFSVLEFLFTLKMQSWIRYATGVFAVLMIFSAMYLQHHYVLDVLAGIFFAFGAWFMVERNRSFSNLCWNGIVKLF